MFYAVKALSNFPHNLRKVLATSKTLYITSIILKRFLLEISCYNRSMQDLYKSLTLDGYLVGKELVILLFVWCVVGKCFVVFYVFSFPPVVFVGTLNLIAPIPDPSILTFYKIQRTLHSMRSVVNILFGKFRMSSVDGTITRWVKMKTSCLVLSP